MELDWGEKLNLKISSGKSKMCIVIIYIICLAIIIILYKSNMIGTNGGVCIFGVTKDQVNSNFMKWVRYMRGSNYFYIDLEKLDSSKMNIISTVCPVTKWGMSHFFMYIAIGFVTPKLFWPAFLFSIVFELFEYLGGPSQCALDLVWNFLGLCVGSALRYFILPVI
jgi:hypothetical protein